VTRYIRIIIVAVYMVMMLASPFMTIWYFRLNAPIYGQRWLEVKIHPLHGVQGDVQEVNIVNHYVGLQEIGNDKIPEAEYISYVYAGLIGITMTASYLLVKRKKAAALAAILASAAIPISVIGYMYHWLYNYTHTVLPGAPIKIEPFDPPIFGEYKIANFVIRSFPGPSLALILIALTLAALTLRGLR